MASASSESAGADPGFPVKFITFGFKCVRLEVEDAQSISHWSMLDKRMQSLRGLVSNKSREIFILKEHAWACLVVLGFRASPRPPKQSSLKGPLKPFAVLFHFIEVCID